jgi:hypothetical protein
MNIYLQIVASVAVLLAGYKPFRFLRLEWKKAVSYILWWSTDAGTHRIKYMKLHERTNTINAIESANRTAKMYLVFLTVYIGLVALLIFEIFNNFKHLV